MTNCFKDWSQSKEREWLNIFASFLADVGAPDGNTAENCVGLDTFSHDVWNDEDCTDTNYSVCECPLL